MAGADKQTAGAEATGPLVTGRGFRVTENAARRIAVLLDKEGGAGMMLRLAVSGGGCAGYQYGFSFDDTRNPDDVVFHHPDHRAPVVIDDSSLDLLAGAELDFVSDLMGESFQVRNPKAVSSCGCGTSFSV